jgi:hypothetical protein
MTLSHETAHPDFDWASAFALCDGPELTRARITVTRLSTIHRPFHRTVERCRTGPKPQRHDPSHRDCHHVRVYSRGRSSSLTHEDEPTRCQTSLARLSSIAIRTDFFADAWQTVSIFIVSSRSLCQPKALRQRTLHMQHTIKLFHVLPERTAKPHYPALSLTILSQQWPAWRTPSSASWQLSLRWRRQRRKASDHSRSRSHQPRSRAQCR